MSRRIALFVEGDTERGALTTFFKKWLDPHFPLDKRVGIQAVNFEGISHYLDDLGEEVKLHIRERRANRVFGLVDLYGLPPSRIDLSNYSNTDERVTAARSRIMELVPAELRPCFRQHFAVHEVEAWLLAYPEKFDPKIQGVIQKRQPETVNLTEPPAKLLKKLMRNRYQKTVFAINVFSSVDPQVAIDKCPYLKLLAENLLRVARELQ